eukprot:Transcript_570.p4 GENE.Transcript_570~~Transcript_570.p4  ORF type:complete len:80 (+),score=9.49 Transcript_570:842-1081(+)
MSLHGCAMRRARAEGLDRTRSIGRRCVVARFPYSALIPEYGTRATTHLLPMLRVLSRPSARALRMAQPCRLMSTKFSKV